MKKISFLIIGVILAIAIIVGITQTGFLTLNQDKGACRNPILKQI